MIALCVWNTEVFFASIYEFLAQLSFEIRVNSVRLSLCCHIIAVLDLILLSFAESLKVFLQHITLVEASTANA